MSIQRFHDPHKELIQVYPAWYVPDENAKYPEITMLEVQSFRRVFSDDERYYVKKTLTRCRCAALKAGGAGILHRVIACKEETVGDDGPNPENTFDLILDGNTWYIQHHFPDDKPTPFELNVRFPEREPGYVEPIYIDDPPQLRVLPDLRVLPEQSDPECGPECDPDFPDDVADPDFEQD